MRPSFRFDIGRIKKIYERVVCIALVFFITPGVYIFEITIVRPSVVRTYKLSEVENIFHLICSSFLFINVVGNMIMSIFTDTRLRTCTIGDGYCNLCKSSRPTGAWHCKGCNTCILRRDHHCFFFAKCIGLYNQRYYVAYLGYIFISMFYATYYNIYYVAAKFEDYGFLISAFRIINPLLRHLVPEPLGMKDLCVFFVIINAGITIWSGFLFAYHMGNVLRGITAHEYRNCGPMDRYMWKQNILKVFGAKWYWALIWPFVDSPLPIKMEV